MQINKILTPYNFSDKNNTGRIQYIVVHYVGALGDAKANVQLFASKYIGASAHYFVGFAGDIWQSVEDEDIAWHCGADTYKHPTCRNSNSIGIELCVRKKDTSRLGATDKDWYFEDATIDSAVQLIADLMKKYNVPISRVIRHYDVTGKVCPNPFVYNTGTHTWNEFTRLIEQALVGTTATTVTSKTKIEGSCVASVLQMQQYVKKMNPNVAQSVIDMIPLYVSEGAKENIRGDVAFAQSCLETGYFGFVGSAVTLDQNNFCGHGVTQNGMKGSSFESPMIGIRAQIQHLKAYANEEKLVEACVDNRFKYVQRGCAPYVEWLGIQENPVGKGWAAGANYGKNVLTRLSGILGIEAVVEQPADKENIVDTSKQTINMLSGKVKVIYTGSDGLCVRTSPSFGDNVREVIHGGLYTVVGISADGLWYKLKSGAFITTGTKYVQFSGAAMTGFKSYKVRIVAKDLFIRKGPGTDYGKANNGKYMNPGIYTLIEEQTGKGSTKGWGRLKSGAGWISLDYCSFVDYVYE